MKQLFTLLLLLPLAALAQRIQSDQTDDFGAARRIATSRVEFSGMGSSMSGTVNICNHDTLLRMNIIFRAGQPTITDHNTVVQLRLGNGQTIQLANIGDYKELTATEPGFFVCTVTAEVAQKLMTAPVVEYSIHTGNATVQVSLNSFQQTAFRNTLVLLQEHARSMAYLD